MRTPVCTDVQIGRGRISRRVLADHGPSTAERIVLRTGSTLDGVVGCLREDQHYKRVTALVA
jgi:hypothetical protein